MPYEGSSYDVDVWWRSLCRKTFPTRVGMDSMPDLINPTYRRMWVIICAAGALVVLLVTSCGSREPSSEVLITSSDNPTKGLSTPLSAEELLNAKDQWGKFFKSLERCSEVADTNCYQNAGTGSLNGNPIAATFYCNYKEFSAGQWACDWMIDFYTYSDAKWLSSGSIQSQLYEMFDGAFFAEMTGDTDSELYFSVMYTSFAEAEVHRFNDGLWIPATFDGKSILYMGYFNAKSGKMESGVAMDMGDSCEYRRWTQLIYSWDQTEFTATAGLDEQNNPISVKQALECS